MRTSKKNLKPAGSFFVVMLGHSPVLDSGLKMMTGESAKKDFADRRALVLPTLNKFFSVKNKAECPQFGNGILKIYTALELQPK